MKTTNLLLSVSVVLVAATFSSQRQVHGKSGPFGFRSVEIFKVEGQTHGLAVQDLDGDGRPDLVVANNDEATIDLFYQRAAGTPIDEDKEAPVLAAALSKKSTVLNEIASHPRFRVEKFYTERHVHSLAIGDFNSDGKPDLAFYTDPPELHVVFQGSSDASGGTSGPGSVWGGTRETVSIRDGKDSVYALMARDLGGDGRDDLVLLGKKKTYLLEQKEEGGFAEPTTIYGGSDGIWAFDVVDLNGDDRLDLLFFDPNSEEPMRARLRGPAGFGPEIVSRARPIRSWFVAPLALGDESESLMTVLTVQDGTDRIKGYRWGAQPTKGALTVPRIVPMRPAGDAKKRLILFADANQDGRTDIVVAHPATAQLEVFFQDADGSLARREEFPTLAEVNGLRAADVDGDGRAEIIVMSRREKVVGVSRWRDDALEIPRNFPMTAEPVLLQTGRRVRGAPHESLFVVAKTESGYSLFSYTVPSSLEGELVQDAELELAGKGGVPSDLRSLDANGDGAGDFLVFVPYEEPFLYLQEAPSEDGYASNRFREISRKPGFGLGQLSKVEPAAVSVVAGVGDAAALLVAAKTYVRRLELRDEKLEVTAQLSVRSTGALLSASIAMKGADGSEELAVLDSSNNSVELYRRDGATFEFLSQVRVPKLSAPRLMAQDLDGDGRQDLTLISPEASAILYRRAEDTGLKEVFTYTLKNKKDLGKPMDLIVGDLNADSGPDVVLSTREKHNLLFLTPSGDSHRRLDLKLGFPIFEEKSTTRRRTSGGPRQMLITDIDQDGLQDLLLLIHDRILLYLQDAAPPCPGDS